MRSPKSRPLIRALEGGVLGSINFKSKKIYAGGDDINCGFSLPHLTLHVSVIHEEATELPTASENGHTAAVQLLLSHGAETDIPNNVYQYTCSTHALVLFSLCDTEWCVSPLHSQPERP